MPKLKQIIMNKLINIFIFLFFLIIFNSCEVLKLGSVFEEEIIIVNSNINQKFLVGKDNKLLIETKINNKIAYMYFDTRATDVIFREQGSWTDSLPIVAEPKIFRIRVAGGERIDRSCVRIDSASCELFSIKNWIITAIVNENWFCGEAIGIIGNSGFWNFGHDEKKILRLNFDRKELSVIDSIPPNYEIIKSSFRFGYTKIFLSINGIEYSFGLDTGYGGSLLTSSNNIDENIKNIPTKTVLFGELFQVAGGGIILDTIDIKEIDDIKLNSNSFLKKTKLMVVHTENIENLVGVAFMKNYNWIIDYVNEKIYIKPRNTKIEKTEYFYRYYLGAGFNFSKTPITTRSMVIDGMAYNAGLKIGDEVISINNTIISDIPHCEREHKIKELIKKQDKTIFRIIRDNKKIDIEF